MSISFTVRSGRLSSLRGGIKVYGAFQSERGPMSLLPASSAADRSLKKLVKDSGFQGALNEVAFFPQERGEWTLIVGLGKEKDFTLDRVRQFSATAARMVRTRGYKALLLPALKHRVLGRTDTVVQAVTEGVLLGLYRYDQYHTQRTKSERQKQIRNCILVVERPTDVKAAKSAITKAERIAEGVLLARDLINGPSNLVTPTYLANEARKIARRYKLSCRVIPFAQLKRQGFGGIVGVAQGSAHPAQFIVLDYRPARAKATFVFCGKGVTFDTGGISIKPAKNMEQMKYDMSGAAAVLGTVQVAAALRLQHRVIGIIAATENMPGGRAQKPGDILKTLSGKTVEVLNTDAEGRLVLSDCLHYAKRYKPDCCVDLATLTGACIVALGTEAIALTTQHERIAAKLNQAGKVTHERLWRLPLWEEYGTLMKSDIADLRNVSNTGEAGTITAAKFLEAFAEGLPWAHLDIAGTAWTERDKAYIPKGAVGIGVRLLIEFMESWRK